MPSGCSVRPKHWEADSIMDLYDDGEYSAILSRQDDDSLLARKLKYSVLEFSE